MIIGYIQAYFFAVIFLLFIDGEVGWLLVYALTGAAIASAFLYLLSKGRYTASIKEFAGVKKVGEYLETELTLQKNGFCIMPYIHFSGRAGGENIEVQASLIFRKEIKIPIKIQLKSCGLNTLELSAATDQDFLGLIRRSRVLAQPLKASAAVLPRSVNYTGPLAAPSMLPSDDEEAEEGKVALSGGLPGYEHRPYIEGDSPRRINYKLSAKKGTLMIRMDENSGTQATNILIAADADGNGAEQAMALSLQLISMGGSVKVIHNGHSFSATTAETAERLREWLAFCPFGAENTAPQNITSAGADADIVVSAAEITVKALG